MICPENAWLVLSECCCVWSPGLLYVVWISSLNQPVQILDRAAWFSQWRDIAGGARGNGSDLTSSVTFRFLYFSLLRVEGPQPFLLGARQALQALCDASASSLCHFIFSFTALWTPQVFNLLRDFWSREKRKNVKSEKEQVLCHKSPLRSRLSLSFKQKLPPLASVTVCSHTHTFDLKNVKLIEQSIIII